MPKQQKRIVGYDRDYPGSYGWPIYEVLCPECKQWVKDYGAVSADIGGYEHSLCKECGDKVFPPEMENQSSQAK